MACTTRGRATQPTAKRTRRFVSVFVRHHTRDPRIPMSHVLRRGQGGPVAGPGDAAFLHDVVAVGDLHERAVVAVDEENGLALCTPPHNRVFGSAVRFLLPGHSADRSQPGMGERRGNASRVLLNAAPAKPSRVPCREPGAGFWRRRWGRACPVPSCGSSRATRRCAARTPPA